MIMLTPLSQATIPPGSALATGREGEVRGSRAHPSRLRHHLGRRLGLAVARDLLADTGDDRVGGGGGVDWPVGARHRREPLERSGCPAHLYAGVSMILFHGGVGISLRVISKVAVGLSLLALPDVLITTVIVALAVAPIFGVASPVALLIGAVLASTDPAILIPLFDRLNIRPKVAQTLISESGFNDTTGAVLTLALVGAVESGRFTLSGPTWEILQGGGYRHPHWHPGGADPL